MRCDEDDAAHNDGEPGIVELVEGVWYVYFEAVTAATDSTHLVVAGVREYAPCEVDQVVADL